MLIHYCFEKKTKNILHYCVDLFLFLNFFAISCIIIKYVSSNPIANDGHSTYIDYLQNIRLLELHIRIIVVATHQLSTFDAKKKKNTSTFNFSF